MGCAASSDANSNRIKPNPETSTSSNTSISRISSINRPSRQLEKSLRQTIEMSKQVLPPHPNTPPLFNTTQTTNKQNNTTHSNIPPHPNTPPRSLAQQQASHGLVHGLGQQQAPEALCLSAARVKR